MTTTATARVMLRDSKGVLSPTNVRVTVDTFKLAKTLGAKALRNKSRKSKLACGVTAEIVETRE